MKGEKRGGAKVAALGLSFLAVAALAAAGGYWAGTRAASGADEKQAVAPVVPRVRPSVVRAEEKPVAVPTAPKPSEKVPAAETAVPLVEKPVAQAAARSEEPVSPERPRDRAPSLNELKKIDPEKYQRILGYIRANNQRRTEEQRGKYDFLSGVDAAMFRDKEAVGVHERLLAKIEELDALWAGSDAWYAQEHTQEENEARHKQEWETKRELNELYQQERRNLLEATAAELGMKDDDVSDFADALQQIFESTEGRMWTPHGPPPGGASRGPGRHGR